MAILPLSRPEATILEPKTIEKLNDLDRLIAELNKKNIPVETQQTIDRHFSAISNYKGSEKELVKTIRKAKTEVMQLLAKRHNIVVKNHFRNTWLALGMGAFGVPIGVVFGMSIGNLGMLGIGLPIGMVIGMAIGSSLDKKAADEDRQLDLELKW